MTKELISQYCQNHQIFKIFTIVLSSTLSIFWQRDRASLKPLWDGNLTFSISLLISDMEKVFAL